MQSSIFSTYKQGENRVTGSILAVLRFLSLQRTERLLGALMEQSEFELVHFQNQPAKGGEGVPDAEITSSSRILVETKTKRGAVSKHQLKTHLKRLDGQETIQALLVLTPDESKPQEIDELDDDRIVWASFAALNDAIEGLLKDPQEVISEREEFLLRHLQIMFLEEDLLGSPNDVVVIPARNAWSEYREYSAYVCQEGRVFQPVKYIAFYKSGEIKPLVPEILETYESVVFTSGQSGKLGELVDKMIQSGDRKQGEAFKVMLLSAPEDPQTLHLDDAIKNDSTSESGRITAFVQNQRYVSLVRLKTAKKTSELTGEK